MGPIGINELIVLLLILAFVIILPLVLVYRAGVRKGRMMEMEKQLNDQRAERRMS